MVVLLCTVYGSGEWHGGCHGGGLGQDVFYGYMIGTGKAKGDVMQIEKRLLYAL